MENISPLNGCSFLSMAQIATLDSNGIKTFFDLLTAPSELVCSSLEISDSDYSMIRMTALKYSQKEPATLLQIASDEKLTPKSTGMANFDKMLGGGLFPGDMVELYGKSGTGKSLLCLYLASRFCHFGDETSCVLYFDMKNDFNANRFFALCEKSDVSLRRVKVFKEPNYEGLLSQLEEIKTKFMGGINGFYNNSKLLILDSVPMVIYPVVQQEAYSWRFYQEKLLEKLRWLADHLGLTIILVNHAVTTRPANRLTGSSLSSAPFQPTIKPAMGKFWLQKINIRIHLTKGGDIYNPRFTGTLEKSGRTAEGQTFQFCINDNDDKYKVLEIS